MPHPPFLDAHALRDRVTPRRAVDALAAALRDGAAPGQTPPRSRVELGGGELLLMPARVGPHAGIKVASVSPGNPARGLPRIQGLHLALDAETLAPLAVLDAVTLTMIRTAAVSALAVEHLAVPDARRLVVVGTGPQSVAHAEAVAAVRPIESVGVLGRAPDKVAAVVAQLAALGLAADPVDSSGLGAADVVACCTTAREPLFDSALLAEHAMVVAIGSHEPDAREVDTALVRRAAVVVESRESALREAGDVILAITDGVPESDAIAATLPELVRGDAKLPSGIPRLFKSVGEAWCDVVVAAVALAD